MSERRRVVLFYPHAQEGLVDWHRAPLPLLALAAVAQQEFAVEVIDERVDPQAYERLGAALEGCLCVGVTALTGTQIKYALRAARFVRERSPGTLIVWGGWHPSILPEQTAAHPLVDVVVRGQGELTFLALLRAHHQGASLDGVLGITFRRGAEVYSAPARPFCDVNEFPPMPYHLVEVERYVGSPPGSGGARVLSYVSSQGCPHRCAFCADAQVHGRRWSGLKAERVVDELEFLCRTWGVEGFYFEDSNFFANLQRVQAICEELLARGLRIRWEAEVRTEKFLKAGHGLKSLLRESGCYQLLVGAESGSQEVLDLIDKDATVEDTMRFVEEADRYGIVPLLSMMVGLPGVKDDFRETASLIRGLKLRFPKVRTFVFFYTPYPGTRLYDRALAHGLRAPEYLDRWATYTLHSVTTPWIRRKERRFLEDLCSFYFPIAYPTEQFQSSSAIVGGVVRVLSWLARQRLRLNWFGLPVEARAVRVYSTLKARWRSGRDREDAKGTCRP